MSIQPKTALKYWLPPVLWMAMIVAFSGDALEFGRTAHIIAWFFGLFGVELQIETLFLINLVARKAVHMITYGVLSLLVFRALRDGETGWRLRWVLLALVIALAVASVDEYRQTFYADRTGTAVDLVYDLSGAALAQLLLWWRIRERAGVPVSASAE